MSTDFFQTQALAKWNTWKLILFFVLGLAGVVFMLTLVGRLALGLALVLHFSFFEANADSLNTSRFILHIAGVALLLLLAVSWFKIRSLRKGGGDSVARMLGGVWVTPDTTDPLERKLLNVVEEMSIASGVPVPPVYLLPDEDGINAFAAGFEPDRGVLGVSRGAMELLSRNELQAVVAHEFSHILNGDMRLNIRLMGVIHGIMFFALAGWKTMYLSLGGSPKRRLRSTNEQGVFFPGVFIGFLLWTAGSIGSFFGNLIKAAVCRQREFLADASAVQFTRFPQGLADALKKIGGFPVGSRLFHPKAQEASHMYFGQGVSFFWERLLATHPPLAKRIKRIDPLWDQEFTEMTEATRKAVADQALAEVAGFATGAAVISRPMPPEPVTVGDVMRMVTRSQRGYKGFLEKGLFRVDQATESTGATEHEQNTAKGTPLEREYVLRARNLIRSLPHPIVRAAHHTSRAVPMLYAMLIHNSPGEQQTMLDALLDSVGMDAYDTTEAFLPLFSDVHPDALLPLIDLAIPALRGMTPEQYKTFKTTVQKLIAADKKMDLFEWTLTRILMRHLKPHFKKPKPASTRLAMLNAMESECVLLLSALAHHGHGDPNSATLAFAAGIKHLPFENPTLLAQNQCGLDQIHKALDSLNKLSPPDKTTLLEAGAATIASDAQVTTKEGEILRGIADSLGRPMPPLLPGQNMI